MNGPVPTGAAKNAFSDFPPKLAGRMPFEKAEMSEGNGDQGAERWATTVSGPFASSFSMAKSRKLSGPFLFVRARFSEKITSAEVSALPFENRTPGRRWNVNVFESLLTV